jgi:alpha-D-xyloside xylohydrolase
MIKKALTISDRKGSFPGMLSNRKFNIVIVSNGKGEGDSLVNQPDRAITYEGKKLAIKF